MAATNRGQFVDDNHLRPRDNSGGAMNREMRHSTDFGEGPGKMGGGETMDTGPGAVTADASEDEFRGGYGGGGSGKQGGMMKNPAKMPSRDY